MIWTTWGDFWAMGGHGFFVWMSYGVTVAAMAVELVLLRLRRNRALSLVDEERELETQD